MPQSGRKGGEMKINKLDRNMLCMFLGVFLMMACFLYFDKTINSVINDATVLAARIVMSSYFIAFGATMLAVFQSKKEA